MMAEALGHLAPAPHAIQAFWRMARAWEINEPLHEQGTGAADNTPVLQDIAPRRRFRKMWRGALCSNEGSKTIRGGRGHTQVKRSIKLEPHPSQTLYAYS